MVPARKGRSGNKAKDVDYTKILKDLYPDVPVVIGGVEASLRRLTHYDYWKDKLLPSILDWCPADYLCYGMGEKPMLELTRAIEDRRSMHQIHQLPQIAFRMSGKWKAKDPLVLHSYEECLADKKAVAENFHLLLRKPDLPAREVPRTEGTRHGGIRKGSRRFGVVRPHG